MDVCRPDSIGCQGTESRYNLHDTWTIRVHRKIVTNLDVGRLIVENGCFVSANTKLCDFSNSACLSSESLAKHYMEALLPVLRKRYGDGIRLSVYNRGPQGRPEFDNTLVTARIDQGNFPPTVDRRRFPETILYPG